MSLASKAEGETLSTGIFYGILAALIWGGWPVVSRLGVQQTLAFTDITALRFAVAGLLLLPLVWRGGVGAVGWPRALLLAAGAGAPYVLCAVGGLTFAPAGHAGVIIPSCMLAFSTLGSWLFLGDRPGRDRLAGLGLIMAGVLLIGWQGLAQGAAGAWIGDLLFVAAGFLWASYTVASRAWSVDPLHGTALVSVLSFLLYLPTYLALGEPRLFVAPLSEVAFQAAFQGLFAAILALLFYSRSVALLGAARGAVFAALVPGVAIVLAYPVLGERPTWLELSGLAIVSLGMVYALGLRRTGSR